MLLSQVLEELISLSLGINHQGPSPRFINDDSVLS